MINNLNCLIVCNDAIIDKDSSNLYVLGIFDRIKVVDFPAIHNKMVVVVSASGDPGTYDLKVKIKKKKNNEEIANLSGGLIISSQEGAKAQFRGFFYNVILPERGFYFIEISIDEKVQNIKTEFFVGE